MIIRRERLKKMEPADRLLVLSLMEEGLKEKGRNIDGIKDLFENLGDLINKTVSGSKISIVKDFSQANAFHTIQAESEEGTQLARLHMLYLKKPISAYYLVYVEVQYPYRKKGLGSKVINHFNSFLEQKLAVGILDNVIPKDDPAYSIYLKSGWKPAVEYISPDLIKEGGEYMFYIPSKLEIENIKEALNKLIYHIQRRKTHIHMRENESMVQKTLSEFVEIYNALCIYFKDELNSNTHTPLLRYMFTNFATKLISFRRRISELIGYTGGESLEQLRISEEVRNIPVQSYTPRGLTKPPELIYGDLHLYRKLPGALQRQPARFIESLPNYRRPSYVSWLTKRGLASNERLTIGDLFDLGFDPTRLKEFVDGSEKYIFERMQARHLPQLLSKTTQMLQIGSMVKQLSINGTAVDINPPLLILTDGGNVYIMRKKVEGIHWDEALEQLQIQKMFSEWVVYLNLEGMLKKLLNKLHSEVEGIIGSELPFDHFTYFVSWNLRTNQPKVVIEFNRSFYEKVWIA